MIDRSIPLLVYLALLCISCGERKPHDPCTPQRGCLRSHEETMYRDGKCARSHKEQRYHYGLVWHFFKPHWRRELKPDASLTIVCDEYEQVPYQATICDETGVLLDEHGEPKPEDYEGCQKKGASHGPR